MARQRDGKSVRLDPEFRNKLGTIKRKVADAQDIDVSFRELTRRMNKSIQMKAVELELIEDAKAKKRIGLK